MNPEPGFVSLLAFVDAPQLAATFLVAARFFGLFAVFPVFTWINLNGMIKAAIAVGLALGVPPGEGTVAALLEMNAWTVALLLVKEVVVGALLGALLGLPIWAAQVAGDVLDTFRGANASNIFDPLNSEELTISGQVMALIAMASFVAIGALALLVELVSLSFSLLPVQSMMLDAGSFGPHLRVFLDRLMAYALLISAPLLLLMLVAELAFVLQAKLAKQFGLDTIAPAAKSFAYLLVMPIFSVFLFSYSEAAFRQLFAEFFKVLRP